MKIQRYIIILVAMLSALAAFCRPATDDKTFNRFYNLSTKELTEQRQFYILHNYIDSAMMCANILASKYGKEKFLTEEAEAYYFAFRFMGLQYLYRYCNYQLAAENILKAGQIANKNKLPQLQNFIAVDKAVLAATQNDLENNFVYNSNVIDDFIKACHSMLDQIKVDKSDISRINMETTVSNLMYLAIKFDKTKVVTKEFSAYRETQKKYSICCNAAEMFCDAVECYIAGNYGKAFEVLQTPLNHPDILSDRDYLQIQSTIKISQYAVLVKSGRRAEALELLMKHEQFLRENEMPFEQLEALQLIWQHYEKDGNKAMADKYALQYYMAKDEFINKSKVGKIDQAKLNLELEQTRDRIQEMSYRQRMQTIVMWGSVIIALLAFALLGMLYMNYRKTKRTNRLLYEKNIALLAANQELRLSPVADSVDEDEKPAQEEPSQADRDLMEKIMAVMESSDEIYNEEFSLQRMADLVASNSKYVSRAVNICMQRNFSVLLNEYRIKEACRRLMDAENYGSYSIEGIARSVGCKSRSNFTLLFKATTGLTPSAFQKMCREGNPPTA